jgi:hypothetical protein
VEFCSVSIWEFLSFDCEFPSLEKRGQGRFSGFATDRIIFSQLPFFKGGNLKSPFAKGDLEGFLIGLNTI